MELSMLSDNFLCKIHHDGSHYVAIPIVESREPKKDKPAREFSPERLYFDYCYLESIKEKVHPKKRNAYLEARMLEEFPDMKDVENFVIEQSCRKYRNFEARKRRFKRKAYLNKWSYFVTITYDSKKFESEEAFSYALKRTLSNFAVRRGWRYSGVWERGKKSSRLHFHCLLYVPRGQMVGELVERKEYNLSEHRMGVRILNTFFEQRFGRSDFQIILPNQINRRSVVDYILKYLQKDQEQIVYSRHLPCEWERTIGGSDIVADMASTVLKFVLYDDVFETDTFQSILSSE